LILPHAPSESARTRRHAGAFADDADGLIATPKKSDFSLQPLQTGKVHGRFE
jgi:hypothetical protein